MIEQVKLRDATDAFVLPLQRTDEATLTAELETLAPESRRRRLLAPVMHLSPDIYDPVALARLVRYADVPDVPDAADLAVTVKDAWQGRGLATALLEVLMRAPWMSTASSPRSSTTTGPPC